MPRPARLLLVPAALALALLPASAASAHVTVSAPGAEPGGYAKLVFRVPSEKDVATTRLEVVLPADAPLGSVRVKPHPGWTAELVTGAPSAPLQVHGREVTEVVQRVVWTADGPGIGATEFDEFEVSAGPLPEDAEALVLKALQTYADGEVVRWIEEPVEGGPEPERPAPVLELAEEAVAEPVAATSSAGPDPLAAGALALSVVALVLGGTALARRR